MNIVILRGIVGQDAKKYDNVTAFSLATDENVKKEGKWTKETTWHSIKCFGKIAEIANQYKKGDEVEVQGKIKTSKYTNKQGQSVTTTDIIADNIKRVKTTKNEQKQESQPQQQNAPKPEQYSQSEFEPQEGDLPF